MQKTHLQPFNVTFYMFRQCLEPKHILFPDFASSALQNLLTSNLLGPAYAITRNALHYAMRGFAQQAQNSLL